MQARRFPSLGDRFFLMLVYGVAAAILAVTAATDPSRRFIAGMFAVFGMAATAREYRKWCGRW
jgi:hypothetical protein